MIEVTESFKCAAREPIKTIRAVISCEGDNYSSADMLVSLTKEDAGLYFGVATKSLSFKLLGTDYNLTGKAITASFDIQTNQADDIWETCHLGDFIVYEQTANLEKGSTEFKAYDQIGVMGKINYNSGGLSFPCTIVALFNQIADRFGLQRSATMVPNSAYTIKEDLYAKISNTTYRDILAEIAGATASLVEISNGELKLRPTPKTSLETLTYANLKTAKLTPKYGPINSIILARTPVGDNIAVTDEESVATNGLTEIKLANNEILDDDRELLAQPILDAVNGFYYHPFEISTEGHGWYEVGDRLAITDGDNSWDVVITSVSLTIGNGIKEILKGVAPTESNTNYALAGGITKTIYNTEVKVDKQGQEIVSVVSRQDSFENQTQEQFSRVVQNLNSITATIQTTGGGNIIHNSVGYNIDTKRNLINWNPTGNIGSESSPESVSYGAISGNQIDLSASSSITQRVVVDGSGNQIYTFSLRAKKGATGNACIHLRNDIDDFKIEIPEGESILWKNYNLVGIAPHSTYFDIVVETDESVGKLSITDLMMTVGDSVTPWVSASDEILSKNVAVDSTGVTVRSNTTNDYVQLNELGLNGFSDASGSLENVFTVNRDTTEVSKLKSRNQISMQPIKIIPVKNGNRAGWSFVKEL